MMFTLLSVLTFSINSFLHLQNDDNTIPWSKERRLTWADFKAKPDQSSGNAALTSSSIRFSYNYNSKGFTYTITCVFEKKNSWGKIMNAHILSHEQGHFDITEIHARKLNKALKAYNFKESSANRDVAAIYETIMREQSQMQNEYDSETDFSRNKDKQSAWAGKIQNNLNELQSFAVYQ